MLTDRAYLQVNRLEGGMATFRLELDLEYVSQLEPRYIMNANGQYIREIFRQLEGEFGIDDVSPRRAGYVIDGGAGLHTVELSFEAGTDGPIQWGDGSDDPALDAGEEGAHPLKRMQVLQYWLARTRSGSYGNTRLHWGQWTDGSIDGVEAGAHNQPMFVSVEDTNFTKPEDDVNSFQGSITMNRVAVFPEQVPEMDLDDVLELLEEELSGITDS
jgi:hypothetical protein